MRMPWGKHKGKPVAEVPSGYLLFVLEESNAHSELKEACKRELRRRLFGPSQEYQGPFAGSGGPSVSAGVCRTKLKQWHRRASLAAHPDRGGSLEMMKLINELKEY
jgi:hypothetical protein